MDVGVWHVISCGETDSRYVTEVMNVSGGCIVRTRTQGDTEPAVAQTLILNMMAARVKHTNVFQLVPGMVTP